MSIPQEEIMRVESLKKHFTLDKNQILKAVNDISFSIYKGETLGLVGESGCGKSTLGRTLIKLYEATEGQVFFKGTDISDIRKKKDTKALTRDMQMIFQDPYSSLNPRMMVKDLILEGVNYHKIVKNNEKMDYVYELLETVGLNRNHAHRYPHEFSGGQRQRISIARALSMKPEFIILDEPISALDVSIQAQVVNLLKKLQDELNLTYLFIAHDLSMIKHISDRVGVMYLGKLVEVAPADELYSNAMHPYTQALLSAIPLPNPDKEKSRQRIVLEGDVPSPIDPPSGCAFRTRCPHAMNICAEVDPQVIKKDDNHEVACHLYN